jgi:hypothetical protein
MLISVNMEIIPKVDPLLSPRTAARATPQEALSSANLAVFDVGRAWEYGLDFYLNRALPEWSPNMAGPGWVWTTERGIAEMGQLNRMNRTNRTCVVVVARISPQAWLVRIESESQSSRTGKNNPVVAADNPVVQPRSWRQIE